MRFSRSLPFVRFLFVCLFLLLLLFLLLSSDAHNHVDDYSGTLGGVRKSTFQLWSQVLKIRLSQVLKIKLLSLSLYATSVTCLL